MELILNFIKMISISYQYFLYIELQILMMAFPKIS